MVVRISATTLPTATVGDTDESIAAWSRKPETAEQRETGHAHQKKSYVARHGDCVARVDQHG